MSLERIQEDNVALQLLCLISFLHPDTIPVALLICNHIFNGPRLGWAVIDENDLEGALELLAAYQFIRRS